MDVRLRRARRTAPGQFRLTLDVVDPEREDWELGDCVVRLDLRDEPRHAANPRGPLKPAISLYRLNPEEPPVASDSRLLWEMGRAVHHYVDRLFTAGALCPLSVRPQGPGPGALR